MWVNQMSLLTVLMLVIRCDAADEDVLVAAAAAVQQREPSARSGISIELIVINT